MLKNNHLNTLAIIPLIKNLNNKIHIQKDYINYLLKREKYYKTKIMDLEEKITSEEVISNKKEDIINKDCISNVNTFKKNIDIFTCYKHIKNLEGFTLGDL
jgi:hypothetical protein